MSVPSWNLLCVVSVPGDGNCALYAAILSLIHSPASDITILQAFQVSSVRLHRECTVYVAAPEAARVLQVLHACLQAETLAFEQKLLGPQCALDVPVLLIHELDYIRREAEPRDLTSCVLLFELWLLTLAQLWLVLSLCRPMPCPAA